MTQSPPKIVLEPAARAFADVAAQPPLLDELTPDEARKGSVRRPARSALGPAGRPGGPALAAPRLT